MKRKGKGRQGAAETAVEILLSSVLKLLESQIEVLEVAVSVFQRALTMLPLPSPEELHQMRQRSRPVGRTAYLLLFLQRSIVALEEIATALRTEIEDGTKEVQIEGLSDLDFNAIAQAVEYVLRAGASNPEKKP